MLEDQGWFAMANIIHNVLTDLKKRFPAIDITYLKSENAGSLKSENAS